MAYRQISENELEAWMAANPGRKVRINGTEYTAPERKKSKLEQIALGISKPIRAIPGSVYAAATGRESGNPFLTDEEEKSFLENPTMFGLKNIAGLASFAIPGGSAVKGLGGITRAAGKGALAGGLGGFGYSEEGKELEGILKGGALGGVLGGGLQAVGEGVKALSKARTEKINKIGDQEVRSYGIKNDAYNKIQGGSKRAKSGVAALKSEADEIGVSLADRYAKEKALDPVIKSISEKVDKLSVNMTPQAKTQILADIEDTIRTIPKFNQNMAYERVNNILATYGDELTGPELRSLYQEIADAGKVYSTGINVKSNTAEIFSKARDSVRKYFTGEAGNEISKIADIYEIAPFIKRQAGVEWGPNLFGMQFRPVLGTKIVDRIGGATTRVPKALLPGQGFAGGIQKMAGLGQRAIPVIAGMQGQVPEQEPVGTQGLGMEQQAPQQQYTFPDAIAEAYSYFPNASEAQIISVAKYLMDQKGGGEKDSGTIANVQQAINMIDQYGSQAAGKIPFITGKIGEFFGGASQGTTYRSLISDIRTKLIKQIAGTAQTPAEMKNLMDRLPQPTDEPAVARAKLQVLLNSLQGGSGIQPTEQQLSDQYIDY